MLKVLVVDDEKLVRTMLIHSIDWSEVGMEIAGEASSARMALEKVNELHPDIVFMDVHMPVMDGLTCSKMILEKYPDMRILILSGHDEFEYASESIKIGIFDYLLKPINAREVKEAAIKVRDAILKEHSHKQEFEHYKEELKKYSAYIRDRQLAVLVRSRNPQQYLESLSYLGITLQEGCFQVGLAEIIYTGAPSEEEDKLIMKMHVQKLIEDFYGGRKGVFVCDSGADRVIIINNDGSDVLYEHAEDLQQYLENNTEHPICIGIGNVYEKLGQLSESYREAKDAMKYRFVSGEQGVVCFRDIYPYYDATTIEEIGEDTIREFGNDIRAGAAERAQKIVDEMCENMKLSGQDREQVVIGGIIFLAEIMHVFSELKVKEGQEKLDFGVMVNDLFAVTSLDEAREYLNRVVADSVELLRSKVCTQEKDLIGKVQDYIDEHYMEEDISLNAIAQIFYTNASYLSRVFKEKTGMNFSGYLFEVRMKKAELLVRLTDLKAYEIGEKVGIHDPHYFSVCFKKYFGKSVSEYRK